MVQLGILKRLANLAQLVSNVGMGSLSQLKG
jgi:hypothetical protein